MRIDVRRIAFGSLPLCIALVVTGCATRAGYHDNMRAGIGLSEHQIIKRNGGPDDVYVADDGRRYLTYNRPGCKTTFIIEDDKFVDYSAIGYNGVY